MDNRKKYKILWTAFLIIGMLIILYPGVAGLYNVYQQEKLVKSWEKGFKEIEEEDSYEEKDGTEMLEWSNTEVSDSVPHKPAKNTDKDRKDNALKKIKGSYPVEGIIYIEKIDLELPILTGATKENMKISVASIEGKPGQPGNYSIAGHRSHTYGRNFNRLDEVEKGDTIIIDDGIEKYKYKITEKIYVKPDEVWVLKGNDTDKEITLVTCHPMINPTHRLIVKGELERKSTVDNKPKLNHN